MVRVPCIFGRSIARVEPVKHVSQRQAGQNRGLVGCKVGHQGATATAMAIRAASCFFWVVIGVEVGEVTPVIGSSQAPAVDLCPLGGSEAWESSPWARSVGTRAVLPGSGGRARMRR